MGHFIFLITPYICFVLDYIFLSQVLPRKVSYLKMAFLLLPELLVQLLKIQLGSTVWFVQIFNILFAIYGIIVLPHYCFEGPRWKRIALSTFFYMLLFLVDVLVYFFFIPEKGVFGEQLTAKQALIYAGATWVIYPLLCALIVWIVRMLHFQRFQPFYLLYLVFPVSQSIMLYSSIYGNRQFIWLLGILLSLGAQIALLFYTIEQENKVSLEENLREARYMLALEHTHYRELELRQIEMARIRHDFNNQLAAVGQLIQNGDDREAEHLVHSLRNAIDHTEKNVFSNIPVVNAVLTEKATACAEKGILLESDLKIPASVGLTPIELCSIFSNLLDSAIDSVENLELHERKIWLNAQTAEDNLVIGVTTPVKAFTSAAENQTYSEKVLKDIALRYHGTLQRKQEDDVNSTYLYLYLESLTEKEISK